MHKRLKINFLLPDIWNNNKLSITPKGIIHDSSFYTKKRFHTQFHHIYYPAIDVAIEWIRTCFNQKDFKVYQSIRELLLKAVAVKNYNYKEELANVMAVYGDTNLQQRKREPQLSFLPDMVQSMGYNTSRFDIADLLDFSKLLGIACKLLRSEICTLQFVG